MPVDALLTFNDGDRPPIRIDGNYQERGSVWYNARYTARYQCGDYSIGCSPSEIDANLDSVVGDIVTINIVEHDCSCNQHRDSRGEQSMCVDCSQYFDPSREGSHSQCQSCLEIETEDDDEDDSWGGGSQYVHSYSHRPSPNFRAIDDDPDAGKLYLGIELEVPTDEPSDLARSIYDGPGDSETLLYCKEDSSINGVEIVTHPITHAFFNESFPFEMFNRDSEQSGMLRSRRPGSGYGLHVHVSRNGFKSEAHSLKWMLLMYRNETQVTQLARRTPNQWTSFKDKDKCAAKAKRSRPSDYYGDRYVAINATNRDTYEVRVFQSTWSEQEFRAAVDLCHAGVTYTRGLTAHDALRGGLEWPAFRQWLDGRDEYKSLIAEIDRVCIDPNQTEMEI